MGLGDKQRDPAVLALEKIGRRVVLVLAAGALHDPLLRGVIERDMLVQRHARLHRRIDPRADAATLALPQRQHGGVRSKQTRVIIGLGFRRIARRHLRIAADVEQRAHGVADNVRRFVMGIRAVLAETGERN